MPGGYVEARRVGMEAHSVQELEGRGMLVSSTTTDGGQRITWEVEPAESVRYGWNIAATALK